MSSHRFADPGANWGAATSVELAIFRPDGSWYLPEEAPPDALTWSRGYVPIAEAIRIIRYVALR